MTSPFLGEFLGTMTLIVLGDGIVAGALLKKSKGENAGWIAITAGWAFAVLAGIFVANATGSPDAHLNPAVTVAGAVTSGDFSKLAIYIPAQMLGAFVGAVIVWIHYLPHWAATPEQDLKLACFCTGPAIRDAKSNWISEIIATFFLILTISALVTNTSGRHRGDPEGRGALHGWHAGLGHRPVARWDHRLRHQPRPRPRPAHRPRGAADRREGNFGLELRSDPGGRSGHRRGAGRAVRAHPRDLTEPPYPQPPRGVPASRRFAARGLGA